MAAGMAQDLRVQSTSVPVAHGDKSKMLDVDGGASIVLAAQQQASAAPSAVSALEAALSLVQAQATTVPTPAL